VRNAGAGPWRVRNTRGERIPDSGSAVGSTKPEGRRSSPCVAPPRGAVTARGRVGKSGAARGVQPRRSAAGEGAPVDGWFWVARPGGAREAPRGAVRRAGDGPAARQPQGARDARRETEDREAVETASRERRSN